MATEAIRGIGQLAELARKLKAAGDRDLRLALMRGLRASTRRPISEARANALLFLPREGGLAQRVASSQIGTRTRLSGSNPTVRIIARNKYGIARMDRGEVRHPVFGNLRVWVTQKVKPGWWRIAMLRTGPEARTNVGKAMVDVERKLRTKAWGG